MSETVTCRVTSQTYASSVAATTPLYTAAKNFTYIKSAISESFLTTALPAQLAGRQVISAHLYYQLDTDGGVGSRTTEVQRHAKPATDYTKLTWNNRPGVLAGTSPVTTTQAIATYLRVADVTADLQAIALGSPFYGWRVTTTYSSASWKLWSHVSALPARLVVVLGDEPARPSGLAPHGATTVAKPVFTWLGDDDLISAELQIDEDGGDFTSPLFSSADHPTTIAQLDSDALGFAGIADGDTVLARIRQTNDIGVSPWSLPVSVTRDALNALAITGPGGSTTDPTPTVTWTFTGQTRWQVTVTSGTALVHDTGEVPGTDTAFTPPKGATRSGQQLTFRVRVWDAADRTPSPGDPGYAQASVTTTYTPGSAPAVDSLAATQDGVKPWVDLVWTREAGLADEWLIIRDGVQVDRILGTVDGDPRWGWRDYRCPPNTDVEYTVRPVVSGAAGAEGPLVPVRTVVSGAWVIDPDTDEHFSISGDGAQLVFVDQAVVYRPVGGMPIKRTFALGGREGPVSGEITDFDGRTMAEQLADLFTIKGQPSKEFRYVGNNLNVPVTLLDLTDGDHPDTLSDAVRKTVSFTAIQTGELPFDELTP